LARMWSRTYSPWRHLQMLVPLNSSQCWHNVLGWWEV
jgi:hypothetical protein